MRFFIIGGTGFIGKQLIGFLIDQGDEVVALVRDRTKLDMSSPSLEMIQATPMQPGEWQKEIAGCDTVINLTGHPIITRWSQRNKDRILSTRLQSTANVVQALQNCSPKTFICANAIGYYGDRADELLDETSAKGKGFPSDVAFRWQEAAAAASPYGHRVVMARISIVLGRNGGALARMLPAFRLGLGGRIGTGAQWFSWIHQLDLLRALRFISDKKEITGSVNLCSPQPVTNAEFTGQLSAVLRRPAFCTVPGFVLKILFGQAAELLLGGQRCVPKALQQHGFEFRFEDIDAALRDVLNVDRQKPAGSK